MNERLEAIVSGRVQMVMYRDFACRKARTFGLSGEVKNLPNGTVRVIAEGTRVKLEEYCARLRRGSIFSNVEQVTCAWGSATGEYDSFEISYDR